MPRVLKDLTGNRFLPLLLVGVVLFCHGIYGYSHQLQADPSAAQMSMETQQHSSFPLNGESSGKHLMTAGNYFAAFLVAFLGATLLLRAWFTVSLPVLAGSCFSRRRAPATFLHPPRGPTASTLQVFRL